jgi:hypothetical protein
MPAVANSANHRCRRYDWRYHHSRPRYDYDRPSVRLTSSVRPSVKARTTSAGGTGAVNANK